MASHRQKTQSALRLLTLWNKIIAMVSLRPSGKPRKMTSIAGKTQIDQQPSGRFLVPNMPPADRIDQLVLVEPGQQHLLPRRTSHAEWLKQGLALRWNPDLPQPFIGYDPDEGTFVVEWQSETECNTLTIDAENHRGWYDSCAQSRSRGVARRVGLGRGGSMAAPERCPHDHQTINNVGP